jgi:hypothetical protein
MKQNTTTEESKSQVDEKPHPKLASLTDLQLLRQSRWKKWA